MPHIVVYGLSESEFKAERIEQIENALTSAILSIPELELTENDISFFFPLDPSITSFEVPVVIIVELLFEKPRRTKEIKQLLAERIKETFKSVVWYWRKGQISKLEVAVRPFNPQTEGFASE